MANERASDTSTNEQDRPHRVVRVGRLGSNARDSDAGADAEAEPPRDRAAEGSNRTEVFSQLSESMRNEIRRRHGRRRQGRNGEVTRVNIQSTFTTSNARGDGNALGGNGPALPLTGSNAHVHVNLEPLVPQQLPDPPEASMSRQNTEARDDSDLDGTSSNQEDESLDRFKCGICFEFMINPSGCGKCAARFCGGCLVRVVSSAPTGTAARCPLCRQDFTRDDITRDDDLAQEIVTSRTVPCRYPGCPEQLLLSDVAAHESETCRHVPLRCRFALYGCKWKGKRGDLSKHEKICSLAKISGLVQAVRVSEAQSQAALRLTATSNRQIMMQYQRSDQEKSIYNPIQIFQYLMMMTCATPFFISHKQQWNTFFVFPEQLSAVHNMLIFLPICLLGCMVCVTGFKQSLGILETKYGSEEDLMMAIENVLLAFCVGALNLLVMAANFADPGSSILWRQFSIKSVGNIPILRDCVAIAVFAMCVGSMEVFDSRPRAWVALACCYLATSFFPFLFTSIAYRASGQPAMALEDRYSWSRASEPVFFGIRYGIISSAFGFQAAVAVAILNVTLRSLVKTDPPPPAGYTECGFTELSTPTLFGLAFAAVAYIPLEYIVAVAVEGDDVEPWISTLDPQAIFNLFSKALFLKIFLGLSCWSLAEKGRAAGIAIAQQGTFIAAQPTNIATHNFSGMLAFGTWSCLLGAILLAGP